jgi:hypothetical protein
VNIDKAIQINAGLVELAGKDIPIKFGYRVGMMLEKLKPCVASFETQIAALRHKHGMDQAEASMKGVEGAPKLREIDPEAFQVEYQDFMAFDSFVELDPFTFAELEDLKGSDGKPIPGMGTIAAKLSPIIKE